MSSGRAMQAEFVVGSPVVFVGSYSRTTRIGGTPRIGAKGVVHAIPGVGGNLGCTFGRLKLALNYNDVRLVPRLQALPHKYQSPKVLSKRGCVVGAPARRSHSELNSHCGCTCAALPADLHCDSEATRRDSVASGSPEAEVSSRSGSSERPHPPSFYCPISHQCMHDPVVLTDGHTYERRHIEKWLEGNNTSPVSGAKLEQKHIFPNHALRNAIEEYFEQVLGEHREAIRNATAGLGRRSNFSTNEYLLQTIDSLMQCSVLVNADLSVELVLKRIMDEAKSLVGAEVASVFLMDRQSRELYSTVNSTKSELRIPLKSGVAGFVACSGQSLIIPDAYNDDRFNTAVDSKTGFKTRNILCVPIRAWKGSIIGVAQLINKTDVGVLGRRDGHLYECDLDFSIDDQQFFQVLAAQAGAAIVSSGVFDQIPGVSGDGRWPNSSPTTSKIPPSKYQLEDEGNDFSRNRAYSSCSECLEPPKIKLQKESVLEASDLAPSPGNARLSATKLMLVKPLLIAAFDDWEMDTLSLAELTDNKPLSVLGEYLFDKSGLITCFNMDRSKLERFLLLIEQGYPEANQYHNRAHGASVLHFIHMLLSHGGIAQAASVAVSTTEDQHRRLMLTTLAGLLAAVVHDYEHVGFSNEFLVKTKNSRAILYNDKSPNENHHIAAAFEVLMRPECNFLLALSDEEFCNVRDIVIDMVLATDIAQNGAILRSFEAVLGQRVGSSSVDNISAFLPSSAKDAILVLQMALKCADLGHVALRWSLHMKWVQRVEAEFFHQGDEEKKLGMETISFLMDREKPGVTETQSGFFDFMVLPLYRSLVNAFPQASPILSNAECNYQQWKRFDAEIAASRTA